MIKRATLAAIFTFGLVFSVSAQSTFHKSFLASYDLATGKVMQLADAFGEDQYAWRPDDGIRSVSEAMMHVASGNYFFANMLGMAPPEGLDPRELEKTVTSKEDVKRVLKQSIDYVRKAAVNTSAESLEEEIELFGETVPRMRLIILIAEHAHEHLGQLIAYARSTDVVPPWSQ